MSQDETIIDQFVKAEMMSTFFMYNHETQATHCKSPRSMPRIISNMVSFGGHLATMAHWDPFTKFRQRMFDKIV